ncbi:MAG: hypothetical protein KAI55_04340, partial [Candidatus Aenigmarchaeota archaeon]|nr:hypothetical protein [Candidatus Aenigmarchaeota archaeon]
ELVHILFASINTIEDRFNESNRKFIEETTAYCIDGMSFKEIENVLVGKYIEWYIETGRCNETEREKYKNLISNKLIPVADYLDRNYPPQFFDIMIRSSSIEELWAKFGNKIEKGRINKNHSVNREEIQNTINETEQTITDCENIMEEINELE